MKCCVLSSKDFLGGPLNPGNRWDCAQAFWIHEMLTGEKLRGDFSDHFNSRTEYRKWLNEFLKIKSPDEAIKKVLKKLCPSDYVKRWEQVDPRMIVAARKTVASFTAQLTKEIARERRLADGRIKRLQKLTS